MHAKRLEGGSSLAWTAVFLITVLMPLMLLIIDGSRLLYIRGRLQTAADAACEAAAWEAGDRPEYINTGQTRLNSDWYMVEVAQNTFASTLDERSRMVFSAGLTVTLDNASHQILCSATAQVPILFSAVGVAPQVDVHANTIAMLHFR
jgi:uncharacterized membrane protein